jgi:hypothetical protein
VGVGGGLGAPRRAGGGGGGGGGGGRPPPPRGGLKVLEKRIKLMDESRFGDELNDLEKRHGMGS